MDTFTMFLNIIAPVLSIISVILFFPVVSLFSLIRFCVKSAYPENIAGKVVLITGASSGIGEQLAYEYARKGACLALVARRKERLEMVGKKAKEVGSPDVIVMPADVSKLQDCKRFVDYTINHFGKLDYLINNAGIAILGLFEDQPCLTDHASIMDINFWGSVHTTHFALPHLRKSKGRIIVIGSCGAWFVTPRVSVYNASKAALQSFFETLRIEFGSDIEITMVTPGMVKSFLTNDNWLEEGNAKWIPKESTEECAKAIVNSTRRGDKYLIEPAWMNFVFLWKLWCPVLPNAISHFVFITWPKSFKNKITKSNH